LADSTRPHRPHRPLRAAVALACALLATAAGPAGRALADGDPASDILATQPQFAPADGGFAQSDLARLDGLVAAAQRQRLPIRVALIASPGDLGSVSELWRRPQSYAEFLGQELSQVYRGTVVVVMPNGVGIYAPPKSGYDQTAVVRRTSLLSQAIVTVQALAVMSGHHLRLAPAAAEPRTSSGLGSVDFGSWLALAGGAALIAAAWGASLRARPPRRLRRAR
jgi:hypothetical protein